MKLTTRKLTSYVKTSFGLGSRALVYVTILTIVANYCGYWAPFFETPCVSCTVLATYSRFSACSVKPPAESVVKVRASVFAFISLTLRNLAHIFFGVKLFFSALLSAVVLNRKLLETKSYFQERSNLL